MDVSFFETKPYYQSDIQGENFTQEYQLWNIDILDSSYPSIPSNPRSVESSSQNPTPIIPIESESFVIQPVSQPVIQTSIPQT